MEKEYKPKYKLTIKYPRLPLKFESGDIVYYNALSKAYVREKFPHYAVDVNEVENNPDFWEEVKQPLFVTDDDKELFTTSDLVLVVNSQFKTSMWSVGEYMKAEKSGRLKVFYRVENADKYIEENKPKPLFITEDGVDVFDKDEYFAIGYDFNKRNMIAYDCDAPYSTGVIRFKHESNADEYIKENKPEPLFITEDEVKVFDKDFKFIMVDYIFEKFYASYVELVKPLNTDIFKYFAHESNADEYIWRNKRVFSYEDIREYFECEGKFYDVKSIAKERSKQ